MIAILVMTIAAATCIATMLGGLLGLSLKSRLHLVLGFSAGAVIGVAFFDLVPEAIALGDIEPGRIIAVTALGFFLYMLFDRLVAQHDGAGPNPRRGVIGAASLSAHSLLDGFGIGIAFQAGHGVGIAVAAAVLAHDFADGLNTVNVVVKNGGTRAGALRWLLADALAPVLGAGLSLMITLPGNLLALLLAGFAGFFLYIGACDLLPASQRGFPKPWTALSPLAGAGFLYVVARLAM